MIDIPCGIGHDTNDAPTHLNFQFKFSNYTLSNQISPIFIALPLFVQESPKRHICGITEKLILINFVAISLTFSNAIRPPRAKEDRLFFTLEAGPPEDGLIPAFNV